MKIFTYQAELSRLKYLYRKRILNNTLKLNHQAARLLVGADCAFHLYAGFSHNKK